MEVTEKIRLVVVSFVLASSFVHVPELQADSSSFRIGTGIRDITGPAAERRMMGYADLKQKTLGIHTRLWSRAFVLETPQKDNRFVIVIADLGMIFHAVKEEVVNQLEAEFPGKFSHENVMISATHTHSGPGGYSHHDLFNITNLGFDRNNFKIIWQGIYQSIRDAYLNLQPGSIRAIEGELKGASVNRSPAAYAANPDRKNYVTSTDPSNMLLRMIGEDGTEIGMLNWFAVHPVSMSKYNHLISADNSGFAARRFERKINSGRETSKPFVAGFASANEGDSSPAIFGEQSPLSDLEKTETIGNLRFSKAWELFQQAQETLASDIQYRHVWVDMPFMRTKEGRLCQPALGFSFVAGAKDGPSGVPGFRPGMKQGDDLSTALPIDSIAALLVPFIGGSQRGEDCQYPKPVFLSVTDGHYDLIPTVIPIHLVTIGQLAIAGVPAEFTTMAGRRLKALLKRELAGSGIKWVTIAGLSNDYSGYVTTPEEYSEQGYEGGFTLYGPNTLSAYLKVFSELAGSLKKGLPVHMDFPPTPRIAPLLDFNTQVVFDGKRLKERFGQPLVNPMPQYRSGQVVKAAFRSAHPNNSLNRMEYFFEIQRFQNGNWVTLAYDGDVETSMYWERDLSLGCIACSKTTFEWRTSSSALPGKYRFIHSGIYKKTGAGRFYPYSGVSSEFVLQ